MSYDTITCESFLLFARLNLPVRFFSIEYILLHDAAKSREIGTIPYLFLSTFPDAFTLKAKANREEDLSHRYSSGLYPADRRILYAVLGDISNPIYEDD